MSYPTSLLLRIENELLEFFSPLLAHSFFSVSRKSCIFFDYVFILDEKKNSRYEVLFYVCLGSIHLLWIEVERLEANQQTKSNGSLNRQHVQNAILYVKEFDQSACQKLH